MRGLEMLGKWFTDFHTYAWCSTPYAWTLRCLEGWRVKAMPRLPGARLGVGLNVRALLDLRRKGATPKSTSRHGCMLARVVFHAYAWAFHAYAWLGDVRGHA
ncbi:hypothetical protein PIB30_061264 [Stylosanthes scabra]|uniref:Uncharacterized protein n=1 Tax=Stylosanthes scabra TaxID=79078 RepID=A0ABU6RLJ9_9FABA|nr:hypothetical protein [Stylosanthes scabra]